LMTQHYLPAKLKVPQIAYPGRAKIYYAPQKATLPVKF
jgi:hypothetical protein